MPFTGAGAFQEIGVKAVVKDMGKFMSDLGRMDKAVQATGRSLGTRAQAIGAGMRNIGSSLSMFVTLPIVGALAAGTKMAMDFEDILTKMVTLANVSREEVEEWRPIILDIAVKWAVDPAEAADALFYLASSGLAGTKAMESLEPVLQATALGMGDAATIARVAGQIINAYGAANVDAAYAVAVLTAGVTEGAAETDAYAEALAPVVGLAAQLKIPISDVMAAIAVLSRVMPAPEAAVAFRQMMQSFIYAPPKAEKELAKLNMTFKDMQAMLAEKGYLATLQWFWETLEHDTEAMHALFPRIEGLAGILTLLGQSAEENVRVHQALADVTKEDMIPLLEELEKTAGFKARKAMVSLKVSMIELGDVMLPIVAKIADLVSKVTQAFAKLPQPVKTAIVAVLLLVAALGPLLLILGSLMTGVGLLMMPGVMASIGAAFVAAAPFVLAFIGVALILIATAPLIIAAWGPVSEFFSNTLPAAFKAAPAAIAKMASDIVKYVANIAPQLLRAGQNIAVAIANGIASAATAIFRVLREIAEAIAYALNPANIVFGSTLGQVYAKAGTGAMVAYAGAVKKAAPKVGAAVATALAPVPGDPTYEPGGRMPGGAPPVSEWMPQRDEAAALRAKVDVELGDTSALDDLEGKAAEAGEEAGEAGGNAFLRMLEGVVARGLGTVTTAMAAPLEALRGVVSSLADEIMRLAGLPTIESAMERLQRAQLQLKLIGVERREPQIQAARDRIAAIDEEEKALLDQRQAIIDENWGREEGVEAIDAQLAALEKEQDQKESVIDKYEAEKQAIEDQIAALDSLAKERDAEREVMAARAQLADKTLATDEEVLAAMSKMQPVISEVTGLINQQADDLWTRFVPAWEAAAAAAGKGAGAGAGAGAGLGEVGGVGALEPFEMEPLKPLEPLEIKFPDIGKEITDWIEKNRPYLLAAGATILAIVLFGWNVGLVVGVAAAVGVLIYTFRDEISAGMKWLGNFLAEHWKEVLSVLLMATPLGPIIALATDAFGIRTALKKGLDKVLGLVTGLVTAVVGFFSNLVTTVTTKISGMVTSVVGFFGNLWTQVKTKVSGLVTDVTTFFSNLVTSVVGFVSGMVTQVVSFFSGLVTSVVSLVSGLITSIISFFSGLPGRIVGALSSLAGLIGGIASSAVSSFLSFFEGIPGAVGGFFAGIPGAITGALGDFGSFLWNTIVKPIIDKVKDIGNIGIFGVTLSDVVGTAGKGVGLAGKGVNVITGKGWLRQAGEWKVPGTGVTDKAPRVLAPGEMVVPQAVAEVVRTRVSSFAELGSLMAQNPKPAPIPPPGAVSSFAQLGGAMAGQATPLGASQPMAMAGALSVNAPISVTVYSHDWGEVRRIVHAEVDTALSRARDSTTRQAAELTSGIV